MPRAVTTVAWVLDLDADLELGDPEGFRASHRQAAQAARWGARFLEHARRHAPDGVTHAPLEALPARADDVVSQAWCPTPRAVARAERDGRPLPPSPPLACLRRVNDRAFAAALGGALPGRTMVGSREEFDAVTRRPQPHGWLLKRRFGFSGRGHKRLVDAPTDAERRWVDAALALHGGLLVEPFVPITREFVLHGWLRADGRAWFGDPATQRHDARGAWLATEPGAAALSGAEEEALEAAGRGVAGALAAAGYFGAFAVDAYRYLGEGAAPRFEPLGEVNARYTMGWFAGVGARQRAWLEDLR